MELAFSSLLANASPTVFAACDNDCDSGCQCDDNGCDVCQSGCDDGGDGHQSTQAINDHPVPLGLKPKRDFLLDEA